VTGAEHYAEAARLLDDAPDPVLGRGEAAIVSALTGIGHALLAVVALAADNAAMTDESGRQTVYVAGLLPTVANEWGTAVRE
jgi:hypothetical protein